MDTLLIEVANQKARGLLHELEERNLIRVLKENATPERKTPKKQTGRASATAGKRKADPPAGTEWWKDKEFVARLDKEHKAMESGEDKGVTLEELKLSIEKIRIERDGK